MSEQLVRLPFFIAAGLDSERSCQMQEEAKRDSDEELVEALRIINAFSAQMGDDFEMWIDDSGYVQYRLNDIGTASE